MTGVNKLKLELALVITNPYYFAWGARLWDVKTENLPLKTVITVNLVLPKALK